MRKKTIYQCICRIPRMVAGPCGGRRLFTEDAKAPSRKALVKHLVNNRYFSGPEEDDVHKLVPDILGKVLLENWKAWWWRSAVTDGSLYHAKEDLELICDDAQHRGSAIVELLDGYYHSLSSTTASSHDGIMAVVRVRKCGLKKMTEEFVTMLFDGEARGGGDYGEQFRQLRFLKKFFNKSGSLQVASCAGDMAHQVLYDEKYTLQQTTKFKLKQGNAGTMLTLRSDQVLWATLVDAFSFRHGRYLLNIHPQLAPVKVLVLLERAPDSQKGREMEMLVEETCTMLRCQNVTTWNGIKRNLTTTDADALGVPFCVLLPVSAFETGVVYLRSLSTTIKMEVHISLLQETIMKYLKYS